jgi:hypothetical protein
MIPRCRVLRQMKWLLLLLCGLALSLLIKRYLCPCS